ncbi:MAG: terminase large subunit [Gammaproteobacteria bacterium]|nr:terminase large subunit [Gammaproteobacteria bacterium]
MQPGVGTPDSKRIPRGGGNEGGRHLTTDPLADRLAAYIESLELVGGDLDGQPFTVLDWERDFISGAFADGAKESALSVARGNGKSALVAGIGCAVPDPDGPLHGRRREVVIVASAFAQARVIFEDCLAMLRERCGLSAADWRIQDSANTATIEHRASGARIRCIGSDPKRMHGLRPALAILDEPAQWEPARRDAALAAMRTSLGKVPGSRLIALGTRPVGEHHWFAKMLAGGADYAQVHAAEPEADPFGLDAIRAANPSYDALPSLREQLAAEAEDAKRDPGSFAAWKALRLNLGVADTVEQVILTADVWQAAEGEAEASGPMVWGVDLGTSAAMSACASYWPQTGRLDAFAVFPAHPGLEERGLSDGVGRLYLDMAARGELMIAGERVSDIAKMLGIARARWGGDPESVVCDAWRIAELEESLDDCRIMCGIVDRRQGFHDGAEDLRMFSRAVLARRARPVESLLLRAAISEARAVYDSAGNAKLAKGKEGGRRALHRDDALAAAILAVAEGDRAFPPGWEPPSMRIVRIA